MSARTFSILYGLTLVVALVLACLMASKVIDFVLRVIR